MSEFDRVAVAQEVLDDLRARFPMRRPAIIEWRGYRVTAGMAYYKTNIIGLSEKVLTTTESVRDTIVHEYAHLLAFERYGRRGVGHGIGWKNCMAELGAVPKVRHNYGVTRNTARQEVLYRCVRCHLVIARKRRLPKGRRYVHINCHGELQLIGVKSVTQPVDEP